MPAQGLHSVGGLALPRRQLDVRPTLVPAVGTDALDLDASTPQLALALSPGVDDRAVKYAEYPQHRIPSR